MDHKPAENRLLALPNSVASKVDLGRLIREVDALDEFLRQSAIREPGSPVKLPKSTRIMDDIVSSNNLNLLHEEERVELKNFLLAVKNKAAVIHMSFSADPTPAFMKKMMTWLRSNIHPLVLIEVGLQPTLGAGCIVRTDNKFFDFSLRQRLQKERKLLLSTIRKETAASAKPAAEAEQPEAAHAEQNSGVTA